jgi:hypothetical protein
MMLTRVLAAGSVVVAAVVLANPAAADPLSGGYIAKPIGSPGPGIIMTFTPCGPDCTHVAARGGDFELHQQGNTWTGTGTGSSGGSCTHAVDAATLIWTHTCEGSQTISAQLTKLG